MYTNNSGDVMNKTYICIDLKSFFASVECRERNLDPLNTNLVVADESRTEKTICLAVTPSLKKYGLSGRSRLFEVIQKVRLVNKKRREKNNYYKFIGKSYLNDELEKNNKLELDFIIAPPQMKKYMKYSSDIYNVYLKYVAPEDIFAYSIDEVFCDITSYLKTYKMSSKELVSKMIKDVYDTTGITATAGVGTNLFLAKIAMDIVAKHTEPNEIGVRIAELDEMSFRYELWNHKPLTDFWRIGLQTAKKLNEYYLYTMGDIARCSVNNEDVLYKLFGVNAEILIDHAWGYEPAELKDIKAYKPKTSSLSRGQVLHCPYDYEKTKLIIKEMTDLLILDLVSKHLITNQLGLTVEYAAESLNNITYGDKIAIDSYGRKVPKPAHGTINLDYHTCSSQIIISSMLKLYERIIDNKLLVKKIYVVANDLISSKNFNKESRCKQIDLFSDVEEDHNEEDEIKLQEVIIDLKNKYGKNAILKGMNLDKDGTTIKRNRQVGGHQE